MFIVPPFYGHITATLGVGAELMSRGHSVCWVGMQQVDPNFIPQGGHWIVPELIEQHRAEINQILDKQNIGVKISGFDALDFGLNETMLPFTKLFEPGLQKTVEDLQPDCIVHDESALAGAVVAVRNAIPYATSITVPPGFFDPNLFYPERQKKLLCRMLEVQSAMKVRSNRVIFNSSELILSFTSRDLIRPLYGDFNFAGPMTFVGPTIEMRPENMSFDWSRLANPDWPVVYVSIGTVLDNIHRSIFTKIVSAFEGAQLNIIANTDPALLDRWPQNFIVQKMCPQVEILKNTDVVVSHCGFNTVNEALYFDKPIIGIPLAWDQFSNADMLVQHGCGLKLRHKRMNGAKLLAAVCQVIDEPRFSDSAQKLGASLRELGGTHSAASAIETLINR